MSKERGRITRRAMMTPLPAAQRGKAMVALRAAPVGERCHSAPCTLSSGPCAASARALKTFCWVILHDRVLNVTDFLSKHPGGELAILTFGGKDASSEFAGHF